ncbi:phage head closure protein [uncultured Zoogloea sp.]|uniref:phage head closure protein n=1 Tax=uncultured Zoogloea sp. TaxID=160237 RepID=UPI002616C3F6|nr:phage head closure protein [uncultured Zoogloea sp.]
MPSRILEAGDLDRLVTIERFSATVDAFGGEVKAWSPLATISAQVRPVSDGERWRAGELGAEATVRFRIRWGLGVTVFDRVVWEGRAHTISAVKELGRQEGQEITAAARVDAAP